MEFKTGDKVVVTSGKSKGKEECYIDNISL